MSPHSLPDIFPELGPVTHAVLFHGLAAPSALPPLAAWEAEIPILLRERLAGVALAFARDRSVGLPIDMRKRLQDQDFHETLLTTAILHHSVPALTALERRGIPFLVVKGPAIRAAVDRPEPRTFTDLDVLVPPDEFEPAFQILTDLGYTESSDAIPQRDYFRRYCREATNMTAEPGGSIDLHHRFSPWNWSRHLPFELLYKDRQTVDSNGVDLPVPSAVHSALIVALHVVSDKNHPGRTYRTWRDLAHLIRRCDPHELARAARQSQLSSWLSWLSRCIPDDVGQGPLVKQIGSRGDLQYPRRLGKLLESQTSAEPFFLRFFRVPPANAAAHAIGSLWPSDRYLRSQGIGGKYRHTRWAGQVMRRRLGDARDS